MSDKTRVFVSVMAFLGAADLVLSTATLHLYEPKLFIGYLVMAVACSVLQVRQSATPATFYLNVPFILLSMVDLTSAEAVMVGCSAVLAQSLLDRQTRRRPGQVFLSVTIAATIIASADFATSAFMPRSIGSVTVRLFVAAGAFFIANTLPGTIVLRFQRQQRLGQLWKSAHFWSLPYYMVAASITAVAVEMRQGGIPLDSTLLALPAVYLAFRAYRAQKAQFAEKERHADEMAALHLRAIEGLACAVEAKDLLNTKGHLRRVQLFCLEIGKEFGLTGDDMEALRAAALLHDVGKLAVPEQILAKPGRLTPEEFAKMKVHPVVGAEIVEQVRFPYPVAPIVRAHHEKWDGSGYPLGLKAGQIPLGARILTAVDCLDALTSDREYRRALSYDEAMDHIRGEAGTTFDPSVVEAISRRFRDLESLARDLPAAGPLPARAGAANSATPGAGFDLAGSGDRPLDFIGMISAAQREDRFVLEFTQSLSGPMGLEETFSRIHRGLAEAIPFDSFAVLNRHANLLTAEFAAGSNAEMLALLEVPVGDGMTGWVAEHAAPVVNGNPAVDPDFACAPGEPLRSALAVPLEGPAGVQGVVVLYHRQSDAFTGDHLRLLRGLSGKIAQAVDNAMKFRAAQRSDNIDVLTGLPNRVLLAQALESELTRARRSNQPVSAVSCVLSGLRRLHREQGRADADQLVQRVALALKQDCRQYDHLGRTGREEFVLLLPGMHPDTLAAKIARLRSNIAQLGPEPVELKVGAAFYPDDGDTHNVLLEIARYRASDATPEADEEASALSTLQEALMEKEQGVHERATS